MNYRHIYHAGNFADVFKHIVLMRVIEHMKKKDKPFFALDTHAGIGLYDLDAEAARKTGEAGDGVLRLARGAGRAPEAVRAYLDLVGTFSARGKRVYPGSPLVMQSMMRAGDRLVANELHPEDVETLKGHLGDGDARARVEHGDGYAALKAFLPPPERRGVVLVDPPFEERDEFERMAGGLRQAMRRWATGTYLLWYPIKAMAPVKAFQAEAAETAGGNGIAFDFLLRPPADETVLNGCGIVAVNPPWTLRDELAEAIMPFLVARLAPEGGSFSARLLATA